MLKRLLFVVLLACAGVAQAAVYSLPWGPKPQFVDANGAPMSSGTLLTFVATSSTPQVTYTDSTGGVANPTTITLNVRGETPNEVWLTGGVSYKFVLKDSAGATVWTVDNVSGVNDVTSALDEWKAGPTPTFVSATSFTLAGDQTVEFHKARRLKTTNSGGTVYSTIVSSVFGASTTVTVANDSSILDSGLSAVSLGILRASNPSVSAATIDRKGTAVASAATTDIWSTVGNYVHVTGAVTITSLGTAPYAGAQRTVVFDGALTLTHNATTLVLPGGANITTAANDVAVFRADTTANIVAVSYTPAAVSPAAGFSTGDVKITIKTVADAGWVLMNDGTIGSSGSGASTRANADTAALYALLWNNTVDADCPVSTGRGGSAAADFAANKTITLPKTLGRALAVFGAGAALTARTMGSKFGAETLPAHTHGLDSGAGAVPSFTGGAFTDQGAGGSAKRLSATDSTGTGSHGVMQPTVFMNVMIKL